MPWGQGLVSGLDAGPGCQWQAPRWREAMAELGSSGGPQQVGT